MQEYVKPSTARHFCLPVMLCLLLALPAISIADSGEDACGVLSETEIRDLLTKGCSAPGIPLFQTMTGQDRKHYLLTYGKDKDNPEFGCVVQISKGGGLLSAKDYSERYTAEMQEHADRGQAYLDFRFPKIGNRAILDTSGFGPGGGGHFLTFTTTDECCDIRVEASGQISGGQKETIDLRGVAKTLSDAYDKKKKVYSPRSSD